MSGTRVRLLFVLLSLILISGGFALAAPNTPPPTHSAARFGAELGLLASAGATPGVGPAAAEPSAAPSTPEPVLSAPATLEPSAPPAPTAEPTVPASPEPTPVPKKGKLIFVDPGHGGKDSGAVHYDANGNVDLTEKEVNLWIALKLADMLRQDGYDVELSRTVDSFMLPNAATPPELQARADAANRVGANLYICIHNNGSVNPSLRGTEVYYCDGRTFSADNRRLAWLLQQALVRNIRAAGYDTADRGTKDDTIIGHIAVLAPYNLARATRMPGVLGESLFVSNDADAAALKRADIREAIARGYLEAIKAYFGDQ